MDIVKYANTFQSSSVLELDAISRLLNRLGNPQNSLKYIHVAGTNGKGSVCAFTQAILTHSGLKCGKYTSPFMLCPEERISIDGKSIKAAEFESLVRQMEDLADGQSQFELWTAAAFLYFKREKCDIVVLECGMGGKGDATNIIPAPECAAITRIGLDHTTYLGNTIEEIAENKCGIIKEGTKHVVTVNQPALSVIRSYAKGILRVAEPDKTHTLSLKGDYQQENAGIATEICRALGINETDIAYGLSHASHPGRFERFETTPAILFDGAHNPNGAEALCESLVKMCKDMQKVHFICAFMADKDVLTVFNVLKKHGFHEKSTMICTSVPDNPRAETPENLAETAKKAGFRATPSPSVFEALKQTLNCLQPAPNTTGNEIIVVFGSLYLYKPFREALSELFNK